MKLVDEIIEMASDGKQSLADALWKCLILAFDLKNEKLKEWVEKELNGFNKDDDVPEYRKVMLHSKGNFTGPMGAWLPQRPLPIGIIDKRHRDMLTSKLVQPIAAYEGAAAKEVAAVFNWSPDLIAHYQAKFIDGFALSQAWQEVPSSLMVSLCEEVRNRVLRFALEIREELGHVADKAADVPSDKIDAAVINYIYGGMNVIAGTAANFAQVDIAVGDFQALSNALKALDISKPQIDELKVAIEKDHRGFGGRTKEWLTKAGARVAKAGVKVGTAVGQEVLKSLLLQYFGLK
jgi:hypothetical protein